MLIEARKQPVLERLYAAYGRRLLRGAFARVRVGGASWPAGDGPVIAYANHAAWWDPILAVFLSHDVFRRDGYGLMDGVQLARYPFFRRVGCFGVTGEGLAIDDARAIGDYATRLLRGGRARALWLFPQGALLPSRAPLRFRSGLARISRAVPEAHLVPVAVRHEFRDVARPECVVRIGDPLVPDARTVRSSASYTRRLEGALGDTLAALDGDLAAGVDPAALGYNSVLTGGATVNRVYDQTVGRLIRRGA
ncbi:glycerol acyltransferase [Gemmatimonadetes bacterium T265]|nr:glycerol acyltransferase [Gemmatimonadetes bacterium T265]